MKTLSFKSAIIHRHPTNWVNKSTVPWSVDMSLTPAMANVYLQLLFYLLSVTPDQSFALQWSRTTVSTQIVSSSPTEQLLSHSHAKFTSNKNMIIILLLLTTSFQLWSPLYLLTFFFSRQWSCPFKRNKFDFPYGYKCPRTHHSCICSLLPQWSRESFRTSMRWPRIHWPFADACTQQCS